MKQLRQKFIAGCQKAGLNFKSSHELYLQIDRFADYAFNKAHSTAYAVITWQMAYLKANYPIQFYIGLLKHTTDIEKLGDIYHECRMRGLEFYRRISAILKRRQAWKQKPCGSALAI